MRKEKIRKAGEKVEKTRRFFSVSADKAPVFDHFSKPRKKSGNCLFTQISGVFCLRERKNSFTNTRSAVIIALYTKECTFAESAAKISKRGLCTRRYPRLTAGVGRHV